MTTVVAVSLSVLAASVAGLLAYVVMYLRRLDRDIQRLNARYTPLPPKPTIQVSNTAILPTSRSSWTSQR